MISRASKLNTRNTMAVRRIHVNSRHAIRRACVCLLPPNVGPDKYSTLSVYAGPSITILIYKQEKRPQAKPWKQSLLCPYCDFTWYRHFQILITSDRFYQILPLKMRFVYLFIGGVVSWAAGSLSLPVNGPFDRRHHTEAQDDFLPDTVQVRDPTPNAL